MKKILVAIATLFGFALLGSTVAAAFTGSTGGDVSAGTSVDVSGSMAGELEAGSGVNTSISGTLTAVYAPTGTLTVATEAEGHLTLQLAQDGVNVNGSLTSSASALAGLSAMLGAEVTVTLNAMGQVTGIQFAHLDLAAGASVGAGVSIEGPPAPPPPPPPASPAVGINIGTSAGVDVSVQLTPPPAPPAPPPPLVQINVGVPTGLDASVQAPPPPPPPATTPPSATAPAIENTIEVNVGLDSSAGAGAAGTARAGAAGMAGTSLDMNVVVDATASAIAGLGL